MSDALPQLAIFVFALLNFASPVSAQIHIGTVNGIVVDPNDARLPGAKVILKNQLTKFRVSIVSDSEGKFVFNNVPIDAYEVTVEAAGFQKLTRTINVRSNLPILIELKVSVTAASETVTVKEEQNNRDILIDPNATGSELKLNASFINSLPSATRSLSLQRIIATGPGWTTQNNGLLHIRGVDDGVLYVVDGIPTADRLDLVSAGSFDTGMIESLQIITGNIPAEFGGRSGAVVTIQPKSGIDLPWQGSLGSGFGNFGAREIEGRLGGNISQKFGIYLAASAIRSYRYLDPIDLGNFNNRGGTVKLNLRGDWHPAARDIVLLSAGANGSDFRVTNREEQELAGQRQRQELRDQSLSLGWQRIWSPKTVSNLAYFRHGYRGELFGSEFDTPIFASQDRAHTRQGLIASLTHFTHGHTLKTGVEVARIDPREFFTFAITDREEAEEQEISEAALEFDRDNPFVFRGRRVGATPSWYVQDAFSPITNLTINAGLRYDHSSLPVADQQFSPRLSAVFYLAPTRTALRGGFNRLYMPPQIENLLLSDSPQARALSPFAVESGGGQSIRPERVSAYEIGFAQDVTGIFKLDAVYWHRTFRNFDDPNVFFGTTIIFPNSVAKGFARGVDLRLDVAERRGWSGYLSYTNSRIQQTGPINGGLFLTDEFVEIKAGTQFTPDHDQRNVGSFSVNYRRGNWWTAFSGRHESGVPLEVDDERLEELRGEPGAGLVNFERQRVRPRTTFDIAGGIVIKLSEHLSLDAQFGIQNLTNHIFAYNFGNPFEGTHFGFPRMWSGRIRFEIR